jgi:hypothetical protein
MKKWIVPLMLGFGITIAIVIGERMSTDAMAVVIGVVVGVAASIPTSVLIVAILRRDRRSSPDQPPYPVPQQPVIVINPADLFGQRSQQQYTPLPPPPWVEDGGLRRLRVVGNEDDWQD